MYDFKKVEAKWQKYWEDNNSFKTTEDKDKKFYVLDMFPYPSGAGLHVGHPEGFTATDIVARYKRFNGYDVLHPIGWDAFGLPAEQYAFKTGNHPNIFTQANIKNFRKQLKSLGFSYDYQKEVDTTDPHYYKWTQWIFSQMYKKNLAVLRDIEVNWCEGLGTVLANEEVMSDAQGNPVSERGQFPVTKRHMKQWVLKITEYADRLIDDLEELDWPHSLCALQRNWIGREVIDGKKTFKLTDWTFSRQRYWGEPFPFLYSKDGEVYLMDELPVTLPYDSKIEIKPSGTGESPLANFKDWVNVEIDGKKFRRETHTMPQWAGSSWYFLAYIMKQEDGTYLPIYSEEAKAKFKKWMPVDLYIGGQEHATLHLIYARFWYKVLYDIGIVDTKEPFKKIINQGMILGEDGTKMSKSVGNVINPDEVIDKYGSDAFRVYEMFMGPLTETKNWSTDAIGGIRKWLNRVYNFFETVLDKSKNEIKIEDNSDSLAKIHKLIKDVTIGIDTASFNTVISKMMVFINETYKLKSIAKSALKDFAIMISPFAPFIAEELYQIIEPQSKDISLATWPQYDPLLFVEKFFEIAIQINGKTRSTLIIDPDDDEESIVSKSKKIQNVAKYLFGKNIHSYIYVPKKIVNFIIN